MKLMKLEQADETMGWKRKSDEAEIISNTKLGVFVFHVQWCNDDTGAPIYDQILLCEKGGGVFLPVDKQGRIGLKRVWRPQLPEGFDAWENAFPAEIPIEKLGRYSLELPRGFPKLNESGEQAALREAQEETESVIVSSEKAARLCANTTFNPHAAQLLIGEIDPSRTPMTGVDPNEKLLKGVEWFTLEELNAKVASEELYCCFTLAAIAAYLLQKH